MDGLYTRVSAYGGRAHYEMMLDGEKVCDITFLELADLASYMLDLLTEMDESYTFRVGERDVTLTWRKLHNALEQCVGALRFERLPR